MIVDASVVLKWVVEEEGSDAAMALREETMAAPDLLLAECANALWAKARKGELTAEETGLRIRTLNRSPVTVVPTVELTESAADLALELGHPVYDCLYLALALRERTTLVTADQRFANTVQGHSSYRSHIRPLGA